MNPQEVDKLMGSMEDAIKEYIDSNIDNPIEMEKISALITEKIDQFSKEINSTGEVTKDAAHLEGVKGLENIVLEKLERHLALTEGPLTVGDKKTVVELVIADVKEYIKNTESGGKTNGS